MDRYIVKIKGIRDFGKGLFESTFEVPANNSQEAFDFVLEVYDFSDAFIQSWTAEKIA